MSEQRRARPGDKHLRHRWLRGLALAGTLSMAGCQSMDSSELTWQTMHAIDVAQTLNAADDPCYKEDAWLTRRLIGEQPSDIQVLAWGLGTAAVHAWVSNQLEMHAAPRWAHMLWDIGTLSHTTYAVTNNHRNGVRPIGSNKPVPGCFAGR